MVIHNEYRDHRNHVLGKWRPSAEACRLGPLAKKLDTMLYRDGMTLDEACAAAAPEDREEMRRLAERLPAHSKRRMEDVEQLEQWPDSDQSPEELAIARERAIAYEKLVPRARRSGRHALQRGPRAGAAAHGTRSQARHPCARLGVEARQFYRRWEQIMRKLRRLLEANGYDAQRVAQALEVATAGRPTPPAPSRKDHSED